MRILYVEDNPELRETIGMLMEGEGRTVTSCASAEEALVLDAAQQFFSDLPTLQFNHLALFAEPTPGADSVSYTHLTLPTKA